MWIFVQFLLYWIDGDVSAFFWIKKNFFLPQSCRVTEVCAHCAVLISWPEGRRNVTSAKSDYSASRLPVWSCASFKQMAARFLPKPPRLQDVRPSASQPPSLSIPASSDSAGETSPLNSGVLLPCSVVFSQKFPSSPTGPVTERLTPPSVWDCCFITQIKICTFVRASPRSHVPTRLSRAAWLRAVFTVVAWAPARRVFI